MAQWVVFQFQGVKLDKEYPVANCTSVFKEKMRPEDPQLLEERHRLRRIFLSIIWIVPPDAIECARHVALLPHVTD